eukprot:s1473_g23.t1
MRVTMLAEAVKANVDDKIVGLQANWKDPSQLVLKYARQRKELSVAMVELEPGEAVRTALQLQHPFTVDPALDPDLQEALALSVLHPDRVRGHREGALRFWQQRAELLLPQTEAMLGQVSDPHLRFLLRGGPDSQPVQLGQVTHLALWHEMLAAARCIDVSLLDEMLCGFRIIGSIQRSMRWPVLPFPEDAMAETELVDRAWEFFEKVVRNVERSEVSENTEKIWEATMEDVREGVTVGPFFSKVEVDKFLGEEQWIPTQRFEVSAKLIKKWLPRKSQIAMVELLATVVALKTFAPWISGSMVLLFVDSEPVQGALVKGYSSKEDFCELIDPSADCDRIFHLNSLSDQQTDQPADPSSLPTSLEDGKTEFAASAASSLEMAVSRLRDELRDLEPASSGALESAQESFRQAQDEANSLEKQVTELQQKAELAQKAVEKSQQELNAERTRKERLEDQQALLVSEVERAEKNGSQAEELLAKAKQEIQCLEERVSRHRSEAEEQRQISSEKRRLQQLQMQSAEQMREACGRFAEALQGCTEKWLNALPEGEAAMAPPPAPAVPTATKATKVQKVPAPAAPAAPLATSRGAGAVAEVVDSGHQSQEQSSQPSQPPPLPPPESPPEAGAGPAPPQRLWSVAVLGGTAMEGDSLGLLLEGSPKRRKVSAH